MNSEQRTTKNEEGKLAITLGSTIMPASFLAGTTATITVGCNKD